ncbi:MAG: response regulator [Halobacteriovoraceae bacterium]|nr:response regulator [Halobacteriovoraceae bacterium]
MTSNVKQNIMIIDDDKSICDLIKLFLEQTRLFNNIVAADSSRTALLKIESEKFDLIIFNCKFSDKNSVNFVGDVSKNFKLRNIRMVIISGFLDNRLIDRFIKLGIKHILLKPFTKSRLINMVCSALDIKNL